MSGGQRTVVVVVVGGGVDREAPSVGASAVALLTEREDRAAVEVGEVPAEVHVPARQANQRLRACAVSR